jgi:capsular exopolysaccharide synthesis family protein
MMENNSSSPLSSDRNGNLVRPVLLPQPFESLEGQADDWNLRELWGIIRRRWLVIAGVATAVMATVIAATISQKPVYESSFRLLVEPLNDESRLANLTAPDKVSLANSGLDYESQIQVLKSPQMMAGIVKQLQASYRDINYDSLIEFLNITRLGETKIIEVRYQSNDANKVKVVLDQVSQAYLNYSLQQRQTKLRQGIRFVEQQLPTMQQRVDKLQQELQNFRQNYDFIDPESQSTQIANQVQILSGQRIAVNQELAKARANLNSLQGERGEMAILNNATIYQQLISQLRQLETQMAGELTRFQESSPPMQRLKERRERLLPLLRQEARRFLDIRLAEAATTVQTLEVQSQELAKTERQLEQKLEQLPVFSRKYTELQRNLAVATDSLNRFLTTRETLQIQVAQTELPWQLIKAPVKPRIPVSPDIKRSLILGLVASLILGLGIALLMDKLDNTYHTVEKLKEKTKQPLLGAIPFQKQLPNKSNQRYLTPGRNTSQDGISYSLSEDSNELALLPEPGNINYHPQFLEAIRVLHTNIQMLSSDSPIRSIVISSAMAGDGKSTVAFHLARVACAMGQRVLLVDADLRRPKIHALSDLNNLRGLSNLISQNLSMEQVLRQVAPMNQLYAIASGPVPPDPTKLLSSQKMKQLMAEFQRHFDLVIYDTPPLPGLADASLLARHADGILLVVRMDKTHSTMLQRALESLKMSRINVLGLVCNGNRSKYYDDYGYY